MAVVAAARTDTCTAEVADSAVVECIGSVVMATAAAVELPVGPAALAVVALAAALELAQAAERVARSAAAAEWLALAVRFAPEVQQMRAPEDSEARSAVVPVQFVPGWRSVRRQSSRLRVNLAPLTSEHPSS
jgi:hypothetical protein